MQGVFQIERSIGGGSYSAIMGYGSSMEICALGGQTRVHTTNYNWLDSPNTTSAVIYKVAYKAQNGAGRSLYIGRGNAPDKGGQIWAMEVSA